MGVAAVQGLLLMRLLNVHIGFCEVTRGTCLYWASSLAGEMGRADFNKKKKDDDERTLFATRPHWHLPYRETSAANSFMLPAELQSSCSDQCSTTRNTLHEAYSHTLWRHPYVKRRRLVICRQLTPCPSTRWFWHHHIYSSVTNT